MHRFAGVAVALALAAPALARADGAFPDSMRVLLPADHPGEIILGTNFGVVITRDGGAHWSLVCEEAVVTGGENVTQYLVGAPPADTLYATSPNQLSVSTDRGCSWASADGAWSDPFFTDSFADPTDPARAFTLALVRTDGGWLASSLFASHDGGRSFGPPLYQAPQGLLITGVESAASAPGTIYLTEFGNAGTPSSFVARSTDGGGSFSQVSLLAALGPSEPRLAAVDPTDPAVVYYRVVGLDDDQLAISRDGGQTARVALALHGPMTAFFRRPDGTLLVGTKLQGAFRSTDGGQTFVPWPEAPHLRALGERAGILYAVADNAADGYALGLSTDGGTTWTPALRFEHLCGILDCSPAVRTVCQAAWTRLVDQLGIKGCGGDQRSPLADAGADAVPALPAPGGCACQAGRVPGGRALPLILLLPLLVRRRR